MCNTIKKLRKDCRTKTHFFYVDLKCQNATLADAWCAPLRAEHPQYEEPNSSFGIKSNVLCDPCNGLRHHLVEVYPIDHSET
ncbi:hypothetical protein M422DRAFT_32589 [Sphaerobolus stellatus SS14]|uniref:Uncharacterized protein n=1 Tax=Sphaerobolus stellatus (strain SS14) TaxID=990650 RepID=A0A0C9VDR8_SPHS4|nr:hypothetical protein M422DRAFT_32589 [Sphaerobolus stellatus SS14]